MLENVLSPGDRLELVMVLSQEKKKQMEEMDAISSRPFTSRVDSVIDEEQIRILMPIVEGKIIPLPLNSRYDVCFFTDNGMYKSRVTVTERYKENGFYFLVISLTTQLRKFQRRQYFRLGCSIQVPYKELTVQEIAAIHDDVRVIQDIMEECEFKKGNTLDLSGGGVRFLSEEELERGRYVLIDLSIIKQRDEKSIGVMGKVIASTRKDRKGSRYEQRIEYVDIDGQTREKIIKYIFEQERKMRQVNNG